MTLTLLWLRALLRRGQIEIEIETCLSLRFGFLRCLRLIRRNVRVEVEAHWLLLLRLVVRFLNTLLGFCLGQIGAFYQTEPLGCVCFFLAVVAPVRKLRHVIDSKTQLLLKGRHLRHRLLLLGAALFGAVGVRSLL